MPEVVQINKDTYRIEDVKSRFFLLIGEERALLVDSGRTTVNAKEIAEEIKAKSKQKVRPKKYDEVDLEQMSLFDTVKNDDIINELRDIDISNLTPMDALNTIYRLQNKIKNRW